MVRFIVITSGKGGVGKTTTAVNLGAAINHFNEDVLLIDGNLTTPNVGLHFGSPEVPVTLNQIILGKAKPYEGVYKHESGLKLMLSSLSIKELKKIKPERMRDFKKDFRKLSRYVIVDSAAGLGKEALATIELADKVIIITNPEIPALTDALKTIRIAQERKKKILGVIVTRVKRNDIETQPETVKGILEIPILGMIPEDIAVQESINLKDAVVHTHPKSNAARAYKEIAAKIIGRRYDSEEDKKSWFELLKKKLGIISMKDRYVRLGYD